MKLLKLNEVSLKLLNINDEKDEKLIDRIRVLTHVFNRFIEKYDEYDSPKVIIVKMQKATDVLILFIEKYISKKEK